MSSPPERRWLNSLSRRSFSTWSSKTLKNIRNKPSHCPNAHWRPKLLESTHTRKGSTLSSTWLNSWLSIVKAQTWSFNRSLSFLTRLSPKQLLHMKLSSSSFSSPRKTKIAELESESSYWMRNDARTSFRRLCVIRRHSTVQNLESLGSTASNCYSWMWMRS